MSGVFQPFLVVRLRFAACCFQIAVLILLESISVFLKLKNLYTEEKHITNMAGNNIFLCMLMHVITEEPLRLCVKHSVNKGVHHFLWVDDY